MTTSLNNESIVYWYPKIEKHRCGYCKNEYGNISDGMWADTLTVEDYQNLIDRGWRRSGKYCYKPIMHETCCPQYTIKCETERFSLSKSQKKVIKKFNRYLADGVLIKKNEEFDVRTSDEPDGSDIIVKERPNINFSNIKHGHSLNDMQAKNSDKSCLPKVGTHCDKLTIENQDSVHECVQRKVIPQKKLDLKTTFKEGVGADSSKPPCKKAKLLRLERKKEKMSEKGINLEKKEHSQSPKILEDFLEEVSANPKHKLRLELVPTSEPGNKWDQVKEIEFELYKKYQVIIHNDPPSKPTMKSFYRFLVNSPLKITLERMSQNHESFSMSAKLFEKYQVIVHNETVEDSDQDQFYSFLVKTPLEISSPIAFYPVHIIAVRSKPIDFDGVDGPGYGSFHQQYWLDDKLIAVGVIDILPRCVSSVYFFYDPDYQNLTLGTYGSLREVQLTRSLNKKLPKLSSYYMGFYIHSCPKMRYKGRLVPSFLLCPETYHWIPIEKCLKKLDANKYSRLEDHIDAVDENYPTSKDIDELKIIYNNRIMYFKQYKRQYREEESLYNKAGVLIGKKCTKSLIFCC